MSVCQNRSIFPSVIGCCGALRMWWTWSFCSSFWNGVTPRQLAYCRPLSVSISWGAPYCATAAR